MSYSKPVLEHGYLLYEVPALDFHCKRIRRGSGCGTSNEESKAKEHSAR